MKKPNRKEKNNLTINERIRSKTVRIIGELNPTEEISLSEALEISKSYELDLILLSKTKDNVGICKILDKTKYLYELKKKKKEKEQSQKQNTQEIKELRFGPNIDNHDYEFKKKHAEKFLKNNNIVKAYVFFKGREIQHKTSGEILLLRLANDLSDFGTVDTVKPKLEGKRMTLFIKPKKKK